MSTARKDTRKGKTEDRDAGGRTRQEILDCCRRLGITPESMLLNLQRLAGFKAAKPFSSQGQIIYSEPADYPEVQLGATKVLADILGMKEAERHDVTQSGSITIRVKGRDDEGE